MINIFRKKDFLLMEVIDLNNRKLGYIDDIFLDINSRKVKGFSVEPAIPFKKEINIPVEDIVYFNEKMIIRDSDICEGVKLTHILNMDVIDINKNIIGIMEDIIFSDEFDICAMIINSGIIKSFFEGKQIVSTQKVLIGEKNILYYNVPNFKFYKTPQNIFGSV